MWFGMQSGLVVQWLKLLPAADSSPFHTGAVLRNKQRRRNGQPSIRAGNVERLCGKGRCFCHAGSQAILSRGNALMSCRFVNARRPAAAWMGSARGSRMKGNQLCRHFVVQCREWEAGGRCVRRHTARTRFMSAVFGGIGLRNSEITCRGPPHKSVRHEYEGFLKLARMLLLRERLSPLFVCGVVVSIRCLSQPLSERELGESKRFHTAKLGYQIIVKKLTLTRTQLITVTKGY